MTEIKQRESYWDNIKGLLILLTVFAHILFQLQDNSPFINGTVDYIYMFHMPAFVFVSGYFGKSERSHSFEAIIKLIFLFFIFNSAMGLIYGFGSMLRPVYSFWYLIALIIWRVSAHHIAKFKEILLILLSVSIFVGFYPSIDNTFASARIIGFYPYYMAGYLLSAEKSREFSEGKYAKRSAVGVLYLAGAGLTAYAAYSFIGYTDAALQMSAYDAPIDAFGRIVLYIVAFMAIYSLRCFSINKKIPLLTMFGRNSLWIFLFHRPVTLFISDLIADKSTAAIMAVSAVSSLLICALFGNDTAAGLMNKFADGGTDIFLSDNKKFTAAKLSALLVTFGFIASIVLPYYEGFFSSDSSTDETSTENNGTDQLYRVMTAEEKAKFDNSFRITFSGDLILLEDQVKRAYNGTDYDFSEVFEYAEKYISTADLAIGVFEGPMAGEGEGYSSSNYDDGKELALNFPDSFGMAVMDAGFDLVTTANNHFLDKGVSGALRTLDVLDNIGLDHTGTYRNEQEKQAGHIKLIEYGGIKMAVLSYTYGSNNYPASTLAEGNLSYMASIISDTSGELFEMLKVQVEEDFKAAKALSPDLIIVLPHMGTQFSNAPDEEQTVWFDIFKENGADIILGDHSHSVQPAVLEEYNGRDVFTAYCPGNFANIYRENQGDTSMLVDVFIDRDTKQVIGGGIVPLYTQSAIDGNYRALPVYSILNESSLREQLSTDDLLRADEANKTITKVVFGNEMDISSVTERYYFDKNGFIRSKAGGLEMSDEMRAGTLYKALKRSASVCFIGDSVTEGTKNGGCPWYEPIEEHLTGKAVFNYSKGACTVSYITERVGDIPEAELYVIALGTNDVRYRDESICAMESAGYIAEMDKLRKMLSEKVPSAEFVFIAPWYSTDGDPFCSLPYAEKTALNDEYSEALESYCKENSISFINANPYIKNALASAPDDKYLLDHIHPNCSDGVVMYSEAVLLS